MIVTSQRWGYCGGFQRGTQSALGNIWRAPWRQLSVGRQTIQSAKLETLEYGCFSPRAERESWFGVQERSQGGGTRDLSSQVAALGGCKGCRLLDCREFGCVCVCVSAVAGLFCLLVLYRNLPAHSQQLASLVCQRRTRWYASKQLVPMYGVFWANFGGGGQRFGRWCLALTCWSLS